MNKHFDDSRYYLTRAADHARLGVSESLAAPVARVRTLLGREPEPAPSRVDGVLAAVTALETRATTRTRRTVGSLRERVGAGRSSESDDDR
ncbi:DUF7553 family protein [Natrinema longum]|uniref:Uncharacterized protein n=1 Tax=Natrinema longum TaxID=370324 RepID=A0A8A2UAJ5_9EURY|nr:hypothetical protein [Natrinema longum]MBZ6493438.1 hypothetical protein [Natrinema longum]QSW85215.1 hypothetical protein J0X27_17505 [Natrinema longum]